MSLLHIISSLDPESGGPGENLKCLSQALIEQGEQTETACLDSPRSPWLKGFPGTVHALGPGLMKYAYSPGLVPWLRANAGRYDAVIVRGLWQYPSFAAWRVLRGRATPYFVVPHGMLDPWFKRAYPLKHFKKWLYWPWAEYRVLRDARAVLFTSDEERIAARDSFWLYRCREEAVVTPGVAPPVADPAAQRERFFARFPELRGLRLILFLGRLHPKKGCDLLIEAFAQAAKDASLRLVMAGPDSVGWRAGLERRAAALGVGNRVVWTGMAGEELKSEALAAAEVFILPSHQENFAMAAAEALSWGVPTLLSNKVNIWREVVSDGAGLADEDDLAGTARLLKGWLALPAGSREAMRGKARECFSRRFSSQRAARLLIDTLRSAGVGP